MNKLQNIKGQIITGLAALLMGAGSSQALAEYSEESVRKINNVKYHIKITDFQTHDPSGYFNFRNKGRLYEFFDGNLTIPALRFNSDPKTIIIHGAYERKNPCKLVRLYDKEAKNNISQYIRSVEGASSILYH